MPRLFATAARAFAMLCWMLAVTAAVCASGVPTHANTAPVVLTTSDGPVLTTAEDSDSDSANDAFVEERESEVEEEARSEAEHDASGTQPPPWTLLGHAFSPAVALPTWRGPPLADVALSARERLPLGARAPPRC